MKTDIEYIGVNIDFKSQKVFPPKYYLHFSEEMYSEIQIPKDLLHIATPFDYSIRMQGDEKKISSVSFFVKEKYASTTIETVSAVMRNLDIFLDDSIADEFYSISRNYDTTMFYEPIISVKKIDGVKTCALYLNTLKDKSKEKEHYHNSISYSTQYNFDNTILSFIKQLVEKDVIKIFTNAYEVKKEGLTRKYYFKIKDKNSFRTEIMRLIPYYSFDIDGYRLCEVSISSDNRLGIYYKPRE